MKTQLKFRLLPTKVLTALLCLVLLCNSPINTYAQSLTLSSSNPSVPASTLALGATNQIIYQASFVENVNYGVNINYVTFTPSGTFVPADISKYLFYWSTTNLFSGATLACNPITPLTSGNAVTMNIWNPWIEVGQTCYVWITADISPTATSGHTLTVGALTTSSFVFSPAVAKSGTMYAGGTQTILDPTQKQFRSITSGNWNVNSTWQQSLDGGTTWIAATSTPTSSNGLVTIQSGNTVTLNAAAGVSSLTINGLLDLSTFTLSGTGNITVSSTGSLSVGGTSNFPTGFTTTTLSTGSLVNYNMAGNQTISGLAYSNLTLSGSGVKTISGVTVNGILSMEGSATASAAPTYGSSATLQYNTLTSHSAGVEWISPFAATGGVIIANTGIITLNTDKVFNTSISLTINSGANLNTDGTYNRALSLGGNFSNSGTFTANASTITISGTMTVQSISGFTTTGSVAMTKTGGTATLQGNVNAMNFTLNGSGGTLNLGAALAHTFSGIVTLTNGVLNGGSSILNENATSATSWNGTGSLFTAGTGTVIFGGVAQTLATASTFYNLTFTNSGTKTLTGVPTITHLLSLEGTATVSGTPIYGTSATLQYKGSNTQTTGSEFVSPFPGNGGVKINNSNGVTLGSARSLGANPFTIGDVISNSVFNDSGYQLISTGTLNLTSGTYNLKYSSFPAFSTTNISAGTTVNYSATATQTIKGITYSNLTISGTGTNSKMADGNITVNGVLNLTSINASATQGCLDMNTTPFTLTMGASATTTGTGDVTGIVTRTSFMVNTPYSFGNQFTTLSMQAGGTLPTSISVKIYLTSTHTWKPNAINRYYDFAQSGGTSGTLTTLNLHYLTGELNGATEGNLDLFDYHVSTSSLEDHGRSNFNTTNQWIGLGNQAIDYIAPGTGFGITYWTLGTSITPNFTWVGGASTDWTTGSNWTGGIIPGTNDAVNIPDAATTTHDPILPLSTTVGSITIQSGGILNGTTGSPTLTISGGTGAWDNLGTFNPGSSTVVFTNAAATMADPTNFYNVTVANGANLTLETNNIMRIAGTLSLSTSGVLNAAGNKNTVEYNGTNQTVIFPNGSTAGYSNLILSGSGTKSMPTAPMTVYGDFTMAGTATATAGNSLNFAGNVTLGSGTTFAASTYSHTVSGNWTNNGATLTPGSSTITFNNTSAAQAINGTTASQTFNHITIVKTSQTLSVGGSTTSLTVNNLTETSGNFTAPAAATITGTTTLTTGTFTAGATTTMTGNVTLTAGTYIAGATTNLSGNWTNNGATFTAGSGTVNMTGSSPQIITGASTFNNLTVNNSNGVTGTTDLTVIGVLNLQSANASATVGAFDMGTHTLNLGINSIITGSGDLTGTTTRTHNFTTNTNYSFGNSVSFIKFNSVNGTQTFPTSISVKLTIGSALGWGSTTPANATKRQYELSYTGSASGNHTIFQMYYLDSELASGINESTLSIWSHVPGTDYTTEEGWSTYDVTQNYIDISDIDFVNLPPTLQVGIAPTLTTVYIWNGSQGTDWNTPANWTPNGVPSANFGTLIPDGAATPNDPYLPVGAIVQYLIIESGGILNSVTNASLSLTGHGNVWSVEPAAGSLAAGVFHAGSSTVTISNTSAFSTLVGSTDFYNLTILDNAQLRMTPGSYTGIAGTLSLSSNGVLDARTNFNTIEFKGTNQTIPNTNFAIPGYTNLIINSGASGIITWPATLNIGGDFTNNKTGLSIPGTVIFDGASAQTIGGSSSTNFTNLTINNPMGVIGASNLSVNGALTFNNDNPSTNDKGALALATDIILDMGINSSTTGPGEVSGIVRRAHTFATETAYSFGSQINTLTFAAVSGQTLPSSISLKIAIGTAPDWSGHSGATISNPINRLYGIIQTGASGTRALLQVHYKDNEIPAGVSESNLTIWSCFFNGSTYTNVETGRSGFNTDLNYVTIQDVNFANIPAAWGYFQSTLAPGSALNHTWAGTISTDWNTDSNWTPNGAPNSSIGAIIPSTYTTTYAPTLPATATCTSLQINAGGVLNTPASGGTFTITGANAPWSVETGGVFNANTSNVLFNAPEASVGAIAVIGNTNFYNLTIAIGTSLRPALDSYIGITGTLTNNGTLAAATNESTIEFNGSSTQNILNPNGSTPGYHSLILSGSGTKNLPSTLNIVDEFINNTSGSGTIVAGTGTVILNGNSIYGQAIGGTTLTTFNNLTIDNPTNTVTAETDFAIGGTFNVTTGSIVDMGLHALSGVISSILGNGTLYTQNTSSTPLPTGKTWTGTVAYNGTGAQTLVAGTYTNLSLNNNAGVSAGGDITVNSTMTNAAGSNVDLVTNQLLGSPSVITNDGTIITQNISTLPIPSGKIWGGNGTVLYNGNSVQTAVAGTFNNMTIDNSAGIVLADSATVNGTLLINSGRNMVIAPGSRMTAQQITNNAGVSGLIIKSSPSAPNGTLIFNNTSMNPVLATVEMYSKAFWDLSKPSGQKYKWQFFGIPLSSMVTSPMFDGDYVRQYNESGTGSGFTSDKRWIQLVNSSTLSPFTGYEITQAAAGTYSFQGQLVNSDYSQPLSYTPGADSPGQHILSNPYTAAIDITQLSFGNDFDKTVYIYNTGSLADWTGATGSGVSPGQYISAPQSSSGIGGIPGQIPSMQGFLIMINTPTPTSTTFGIPYSSVVTRNKDIQRVHALSNTTTVFTRIDISGSRYSDKMWIITNPSCTRGYDNGWDGYKLFGSTLAPQIWAIEAAGDFQVDALNDINNTFLGFIKGEDTNYKMTFTHESLYSNYPSLFLVDSLENTLTDITESGTTYSFTSDQTVKPYRRFKIVTSDHVTSNAIIQNTVLKIFSSQQTIFVQNQTDIKGSFMLYSISGQLILEKTVNANALTTIPTNLPAGTYLGRVKTNQKELIEHIIIRK